MGGFRHRRRRSVSKEVLSEVELRRASDSSVEPDLVARVYNPKFAVRLLAEDVQVAEESDLKGNRL